MRRTLGLLLATVAIVVGSGCYHTRVFTTGQPATAYSQQTVHSLFWGLVQQNVEPPTTNNCVSHSMQEVRVTTNFGYAVLTVVTLGIWSPLEIEWRCAKQPAPGPVPLGFAPPEPGGFPAERTPIPSVLPQEETHGAKWPS